jgi:hypothetical protein
VKSALAIVVILILGACVSEAETWQKEGAAGDGRSRDLAECRSEARRAVQRDVNIDTDIMASRGTDWQNSGVITARRDTMQSSNAGRFDDVVAGCMRGRGYAPAAKKEG